MSASDDGSAKLWRIEEQGVSLVESFRFHTCKVTCCAFVPDTDLIVTGGWDGTVRFMSLSRRELLATCHVVLDGYLWTTPPDEFAPCGWLHTDRFDLIDIVSSDLQGGEPVAVTDEAERRQYLRRYHDPAMVMDRIANHDRYAEELQARLQLKRLRHLELEPAADRHMKRLSHQGSAT